MLEVLLLKVPALSLVSASVAGSGDGTLHAWSISRCNDAAIRILARQLVRLRQQITNLQGSHAQIRGVATHTQAMYSNTSISVGMKGASKAMAAMNKRMAPAKQAKVMQEFQQSAQMDMTLD
ncbi:vacuolar protein sorting-associated protein 2 homolog 2-like [Magnolia sinica]|uniref:vacuolar protein sorting-associated protein 2 homolog 2-like n=1 Tax=Magnolia sinica TaxID=86752 RepID=UPI002657E7A7|nr:vacuolar protein sorting-associated protein 2 homolog 2-like [Magnolia sinica]